jgi:hypothetical protein
MAFQQYKLHNYLNELILWSWAPLTRPPVVMTLDSFPAFYGTQRFNTEFTRALRLILSWARPIQSTYINYILPQKYTNKRTFHWTKCSMETSCGLLLNANQMTLTSVGCKYWIAKAYLIHLHIILMSPLLIWVEMFWDIWYTPSATPSLGLPRVALRVAAVSCCSRMKLRCLSARSRRRLRAGVTPASPANIVGRTK